MGLKLLIATLIALAMAFVPLASLGGAAAAAPANTHHSQMIESSHCNEQPAGEHGDKAGEQFCCVATCTALAFNPQPAHIFEQRPAGSRRASPSQFQLGYSAELPTPPPRLA